MRSHIIEPRRLSRHGQSVCKIGGPAYDLPIALALVMASQQVPEGDGKSLFLGELSLDGDVRHTDGILPMVSLARDKGVQTVFVPARDALEASLVEGIEVV